MKEEKKEDLYSSEDNGIRLEVDNGYAIFRFLSLLFLPEKYSYKRNWCLMEGIPIGWVIIGLALLVKIL